MRRTSKLITACILFILLASALPPFVPAPIALADSGTPTVTPGTNPNAIFLGAIRYQSLVPNKQDAEIFLGMPTLGATADRSQKSVIWAAENDITFRYDKPLNRLITTIQNSYGLQELFYASFTNKLQTFRFGGDLAATTSALSALNYMQIVISRGELDPASIALANVQLNGQPLGDFIGTNGTQSWKVEGFDFSNGFVLTGKVFLNNLTLTGEVNKIDIIFGHLDLLAPVVSGLQVAPSLIHPGEPYTLTARISDETTGRANIASAAWSPDGAQTWQPVQAQDGAYDEMTEMVTAALTAPDAPGTYSICVRSADTRGNLSTGQCLALNVLENQPPQVLQVQLDPAPVRFSGQVDLTALLDDSSTGASLIQSAEFSLDGGLTWAPLEAVDALFDTSTEAVTSSFFAPDTAGAYQVCVRGTDQAGNLSTASCQDFLVLDDQGPAISMVSADPNPVSFGKPVKLSAQVDDRQHGASNLYSAEWSLDGGQAWQAMDAEDGAWDSSMEEVSAGFLAPQQAGEYEVCVRSADAAGNASSASCTTLTVIDDQGPRPFDVTVSPQPVKIGVDLVLSARVDDSQSGGSAVTKAEYQLDGGNWQPLQVVDGAFDSADEAVTATLAAPGAAGSHKICLRGADAAGNTGEEVCIQLNAEDHRAPVVSQVSVSTKSAAIGQSITLQAKVSDESTGRSNILSASYSLDKGITWLPMQAEDGAFDGVAEVVVVRMAAPNRAGESTLCVRGSDASGNTSEKTCITLITVDDQSPSVTMVTLSPQSVQSGAPVMIAARIADDQNGGSTVSAAEWSRDEGETWQPVQAEDGAFDEDVESVKATFTAPDAAGSYKICMRGSDAADNQSAPSCVVLEVTDPGDTDPGDTDPGDTDPGDTTLFIPMIFKH